MVLFKDDLCVYIGNLNPVLHAHHALEICIALDGEIHVTTGKTDHGHHKAVVIDADTEHRILIDKQTGKKLTILIDADTTEATEIKKKFLKGGKKFSSLGKEYITAFLPKVQALINHSGLPNGKDLLNTIRSFINSLTEETSSSAAGRETDKRILHIQQKIKENIANQRFYIGTFAEELSLSESRLLHLFKDEVGIPFRKYVLWIRLKQAVTEIQKGHKITEAATLAGFSDASHFSNIYTKMMGVKPSAPLKSSAIIRDF